MSTDPLWPIRASIGTSDEKIVDGALSLGQSEAPALKTQETSPSDWGLVPSAANATGGLHAPVPARESCIQTGAHTWKLPRYEGHAEARFMVGKCLKCEMTKRFPTQHWDRILKKRGDRSSSTVASVKSVAAIRVSERSWAPALDAIMYLGAGSRSELSKLARQISNSAIFEQHFTRSLEAIGLLETTRDASLDVTGFEVAAAVLAQLQDGSSLLTGHWPRAHVNEARFLAKQLGVDCEIVEPETANLTLVRVEAETLAAAMGESPSVARDTGPQILLRLPHISDLVAGLKPLPNPLMPGKFETYSPADNRWYSVDSLGVEGGFRRRNIAGTKHYVRFATDLQNDEARRAPSDLCKYLSAWATKKSLVRYDKALSRLSVPIGAPLPGLYERAAVLCSGELPLADRASWSLHYDEIPADFADNLIARLT